MSGGSYDYLCHKFAEDWLAGPPYQAQQMADRLAVLGYHDAAVAMNDLIAQVRIARARIEPLVDRLQPVMKAVEWMDSGDWTADAVASAVEEFRR